MHLYIHIPFCKQACYYCDFHFSTNLSYKNQMVAAIAKEIALQKDYLVEKKLQTIYFGGGTPSLLSADNFTLIFETIKQHFDIQQVKEITLEANPDDISQENIDLWKSFNINRLSLGIQTFDDEMLKFMNRAHNQKQTLVALGLLKNNHFDNISIDLIYARIQEKNHEKLQFDLEQILVFDLPHISAYNLTIEEKTVLGKWLKQNKIKASDEDFAVQQFDILVETLAKSGYEQYEISNFAKNQQYAIHNSSYWLNEEYLGIGPSAHSYDLTNRQSNISNNALYIQSIERGFVPSELEILSTANKINDYLLSGLRTIWGVDIKKISQMTDEIPSGFWETINKFKNLDWLIQDENILKISQKGRIFSDKIASELFFE